MTAKHLMSSAILLLALSLPACAQRPKSITLVSEGETKTVTVEAGSDEYYAGGRLKRAFLVAPAVVQGYPVKGWMKLDESGALRRFKLSADHRLNGVMVPADSEVISHNYPLETVALSRDVTIDGIPCRGGMKIHTRFFPSGKLMSCYLSHDATIGNDKIPCRASLLRSVAFHEDGRLKECALSEELERGDRVFEPGTIYAMD